MHPREASKWLTSIALISALACLPCAAAKNDGDKGKGKGGPTRFNGLDRNNDGRITRNEWRGSDRSFSVHDTNGDGVIAGSEAGSALTEGYGEFVDLDRNHDGRISRNEWRWERADFGGLDGNQDGSLTRSEYMDVKGEEAWQHAANSGDVSLPAHLQVRFTRLDLDGNNRISRDEWDGDSLGFSALNGNNDGALSRGEFLNVGEARRALFQVFDVDGNGAMSRSEWKGDKHSFARLDTNEDGKLMREEFLRSSDNLEQSFSELDRDQNGRLSPAEWRGDKKAFGSLDDNHDGQLSLEEFVGVN